MITLALDEGGQFENLRSDRCMIIGGVVYCCEDNQDAQIEQNRIAYFLRTICDEQNATYPQDLHYDRETNNTGKVRRVKSALICELPSFLKNHGRWYTDQGRKGKYCLYFMVGDRGGIHANATGNLSDDAVGANRYDHMVYRAVENVIFYNPALEEENIRLDLATRVVNTDGNPELRSQLLELGFGRVPRNNAEGGFYDNLFEVTNEASFRVAVAMAVDRAQRGDMHFDINVRTINYSAHYIDQVFLYLADTICSLYQHIIENVNNVKEAYLSLNNGLHNDFFGIDILGWVYEQTDIKWRDIWDHYIMGDWFYALKNAAELHISRGTIENIYDSIWNKAFLDKLISTQDEKAINEALFKLNEYMDDRMNYSQEVAGYIISALSENMEMFPIYDRANKYNFILSKAKIALYNHYGQHELALAEYDKCMGYASYVPVEEFIGIQLRQSTALCDALQFEKAEDIARSAIACHELINEMKMKMFSDRRTILTSYGRSLSAYGQCLAFNNKTNEALEVFTDALRCFEESEGDWLQTQSYYLHALIEAKEKKTYIEEAKKYFSKDGIIDQLNSAMSKRFDPKETGDRGKFPIFVYMKGIWTFYRDEVGDRNLNKILRKVMNYYTKSHGGHPWQCILKYCAMLYAYRFENDGEHSESEKYMKLASSSVKIPDAEGSIIQDIVEEGLKQYNSVLNGTEYIYNKIRFTYL